MNLRTVAVTATALAACCLGCGGGASAPAGREPVFPVSGKITYKGKPVDGADVTFFCKDKDKSAFGRTDKDGSFRLTTYSSNDGAIAGKHVVVVSKFDVPPPTKEYDINDINYQPPGLGQSTSPPSKKLLPAKYADAKTSDLIAVVSGDGGPNDMTLELKD